MNYDLLLHIDDNDPNRLNLALNNAANYMAALPDEKFKVVLVANGPAAQLFGKKASEGEDERSVKLAQLEKKAAELTAKGLSIRVCRNALNGFCVAEQDLWPCCEVTCGAMVELVRLQREGYAYVKP